MNSHGLKAAVGCHFIISVLLINLSCARDVHELIVIFDDLLSKAFAFNGSGSVGVPFNPSVFSVWGFSSIFKSRNSLNMWGFFVLQALHVGLVNDLSPDNFTLWLLGVFLGFSAERCEFSSAPS